MDSKLNFTVLILSFQSAFGKGFEMRFAFDLANGGVEVASSDDPDTARKTRLRPRRNGFRSSRRAFAWGIAMLLLGLSAGLMIGSIVIGKPADPTTSDILELLQFALFAGTVCALLILLADAGRDSAGTAAAQAGEDRVADRPTERPAAASAVEVAERTAEGSRSAADEVVAATDARDPLAPLRESDAELLQRLVMSTDRYDIVCGRLARRFMLSPRQAEVLNLLARGRNASYIEDKLCISLSTAKSHISGVYRKLGVHTQQELLALVQNEIDETERK